MSLEMVYYEVFFGESIEKLEKNNDLVSIIYFRRKER